MATEVDNPLAAASDKRQGARAGRVLLAAAGILLVLFGAVLLWGTISTQRSDLTSQPNPSVGFDDALVRFAALEEAEAGRVTELTQSQLFSTGAPTEQVYVLIHGTTNSPHQFVEMGEMLHANGHNVLILRLPRHGLTSHDVGELSALTAEELRAYADETIDLAVGLGDEVTVVGLSGGGAIGAWIAQNRPDVDRALLLAPFVGIAKLPRWADTLLMNLAAGLPNVNLTSASEDDRAWGYRGESTRGVAAFLGLGHAVFEQAAGTRPAVAEIDVLSTAVDDNVNNRVIDELVQDWREMGAAVTTYQFPADLAIPHDMVDVSTEPAKRALVFAEIFDLLGEDGADDAVTP